ncbi:MAG TPA: putative lipid II flippase FtsW [Actinomycetota bacterium]|nr:putative lipid II flippase FtsW [Actinomycetota bacterium]
MTVVQLARTRLGLRRKSRARARAKDDIVVLNSSGWMVAGISATLLVFGLVMILSSSSVSAAENYGSPFYFVKRQLLWATVGLIAAVAVARSDYRRWRPLSWLLLGVSLIGLVAVLLPGVGIRVSGSSRWLGFGWVRIQPSEFAKLALLLVAADVVARKQHRLATMMEIFKPLGVITLLIIALVMKQPDLGTTLVIGLIVFVILFVGSVPMRLIAGMAAAGVGGTLALAVSAPYRKERLMNFLDPFADALGSGYQAVQGLIAVGSGGMFGVGLGESRQKWLYVPNAHTDFIFAIIGEELGLLGTLAVLALFLGLAYAGIRIARRAPDTFGRLVAAGITVWIVGQAVINMGAVTGLLPITGVPLPLMSFGGSALVFTMAAIGMLVAVARREQWPPPKEGDSKA